ncbi:AbrB/MazE/SpoVT family DNA-binding domain-containing protein [Deinococcus pimensis]|uniref:AbrB/MazE/SpoVT family DNA-binding domain-containing protein n=1 Tax=Deinococcus pimensis TaxID=309888 RepID=UPI0012F9F32E|nr:AbrB/MazE/SpoVT family DNA-binding domain-containing protein [Deinococcus pimensis]
MTTFKVDVKEHGRINLPRSLRQRLRLEEGDQLLFRIDDEGRAEVTTTSRAVRSIVGLYAHAGGERSLADELIAERHEDAARE